jgi:hypothetical protein
LSGKINQKRVNYAKQSQFIKKSNVYNRSFDNELQQKMDIGHLVKTNPNEPNFMRLKNTPDGIRTCDLRFRKPTLYPTELRAQLYF